MGCSEHEKRLEEDLRTQFLTKSPLQENTEMQYESPLRGASTPHSAHKELSMNKMKYLDGCDEQSVNDRSHFVRIFSRKVFRNSICLFKQLLVSSFLKSFAKSSLPQNLRKKNQFFPTKIACVKGLLIFLLYVSSKSVLYGDVVIISDFSLDIEPKTEQLFSINNHLSELHWAKMLSQELERQGEKLLLFHICDPNIKNIPTTSIRAVIFNNGRISWLEQLHDMLSQSHAKKILITWEPPTVIPELHQQSFWDMFDVVVTWDSARVSPQKVVHFLYPTLLPMKSHLKDFSKRRLLTQISANKYFYGPRELYSFRKKINDYFNQHPEYDFTFYGHGWNPQEYCCYGGSILDKFKTLENFRFSICFENTYDIKGYVTEKIFDCFCVGCIPIYYGASDISKYIPKECYIPWEDFKSIPKLYTYLENMGEKEYLQYVAAIRSFLFSEKAQAFTNKALFKTLINIIRPTQKSYRD